MEKDDRGQYVRRMDTVAAERRHCLEGDIAGPLNGFILGGLGGFAIAISSAAFEVELHDRRKRINLAPNLST